MLSRHFLRIRVFQTLYSYNATGLDDLSVIDKNFVYDIEHLNTLEINQIYALVHLMDFAATCIEEARHKYIPTQEDLNPNMRFVENKFINQIKNNTDFQKICIDQKINLSSEDNIFRGLYNKMRESDKYKDYMNSEISDYETDKKFALEIYKMIVNCEAIIDYFNERTIFWESDFSQNAQFTYTLLKGITEEWKTTDKMPLVFDKTSPKEVDDLAFARDLLHKNIMSWDDSVEMITKNLKQWEYDRVPIVDIILIKMAITEFVGFPSIPEPVTMNEYIELAKEFSTDRSKLFVNGILDRIHIELRAKGKIQKSGRGIYNGNIDNNEQNL